jgi:hypothetical protein
LEVESLSEGQREFAIRHVERELHQFEVYGPKLRWLEKKLARAIDSLVANLERFGDSAPTSL